MLRDAYPSKDFPDRSVKLYAQMLADLDDRLVVEAVKRIVNRSTFLPTIAEIRREVAEAVVRLPTPVEAWEMVNDEAMIGSLPAVVHQSLQAVGGRWSLRMSESPQILMSQFLKDYVARREHALHEVMGATVTELLSPTLAALPVSTAITPRVERGE